MVFERVVLNVVEMFFDLMVWDRVRIFSTKKYMDSKRLMYFWENIWGRNIKRNRKLGLLVVLRKLEFLFFFWGLVLFFLSWGIVLGRILDSIRDFLVFVVVEKREGILDVVFKGVCRFGLVVLIFGDGRYYVCV